MIAGQHGGVIAVDNGFMLCIEKACSKCNSTIALDGFPPDKRAKDGRASACRKCQSAANQAWAKANREKVRRIEARWRETNPDGASRREKAWRAKNHSKKAENQTTYARRHPHKINALIAARKARKLNATPSWSQPEAIAAIYAKAAEMTRATGVVYHVDHIVPLLGRTVCGLHVEANLQILPAVENLAKHNRFWPDMPCP